MKSNYKYEKDKIITIYIYISDWCGGNRIKNLIWHDEANTNFFNHKILNIAETLVGNISCNTFCETLYYTDNKVIILVFGFDYIGYGMIWKNLIFTKSYYIKYEIQKYNIKSKLRPKF